jgi:hypothetical protein
MDEVVDVEPDPGLPAKLPDAATKLPRHLTRRILTWVLVVLFGIMTPLALTSAWAVKTVTNTDRYVSTMQPLADDPVIQNYVATKATNVLFEQLNVQQKIATTLPVAGRFIAAPLTAQLKSFANKQILKIVSSTWFSELWAKSNKVTQQQALAIMTGKPAPASKTQKLVVQLSPLLISAIDALDHQGITVFDPVKKHLEAAKQLKLQIMESKQVKSAQWFFKLAIDARTALLIITPLLGVGAIAVAVRRRRAAFRVAVAGALGCIVLSSGITFARQAFVSHAPSESQEVADHIFGYLSRYLTNALDLAITLFVIAAVVLWVVGDTAWAVAGRRAVVGGTKQLGEAIDDARKSETAGKVVVGVRRAGRYVGRTPGPFRWIGIVVAAVFVLATSSTVGLWWTLIILALYQIAIIALERWSSRGRATPRPEELAPSALSDSSGSED